MIVDYLVVAVAHVTRLLLLTYAYRQSYPNQRGSDDPIFSSRSPIPLALMTDPNLGLVAHADFAVWRAMVESAWCGTLASLSLLLQKVNDDAITDYVLRGKRLDLVSLPRFS